MMDTRQKFEWDVKGRCPQSAFKDGKFNPEYVEWLENEYIPFELKGLIKKLETQLAETRAENETMFKTMQVLRESFPEVKLVLEMAASNQVDDNLLTFESAYRNAKNFLETPPQGEQTGEVAK